MTTRHILRTCARWGVLALTLAFAWGSARLPVVGAGRAARADDDAQAKELRKARLQFLVTAASHFTIKVGEDETPAALKVDPALVWDNPVSGTLLGNLVVYTRTGRPDVMAQFSLKGPESMFHEFHNFCGENLVMKRGNTSLWAPARSSTEWKPIATDEKPAATPQLRLVQMRRLAERFVVEDDFGWTKEEKQTHRLRLLTTPVYRYQDESTKTIDGAAFVFALATDPEAVLLIECAQEKSGPAWRYGFGPMTIYALRAKLNDTQVWQIDERREFGVSNSVQYVSPYRLAPDEQYPK